MAGRNSGSILAWQIVSYKWTDYIYIPIPAIYQYPNVKVICIVFEAFLKVSRQEFENKSVNGQIRFSELFYVKTKACWSSSVTQSRNIIVQLLNDTNKPWEESNATKKDIYSRWTRKILD